MCQSGCIYRCIYQLTIIATILLETTYCTCLFQVQVAQPETCIINIRQIYFFHHVHWFLIAYPQSINMTRKNFIKNRYTLISQHNNIVSDKCVPLCIKKLSILHTFCHNLYSVYLKHYTLYPHPDQYHIYLQECWVTGLILQSLSWNIMLILLRTAKLD